MNKNLITYYNNYEKGLITFKYKPLLMNSFFSIDFDNIQKNGENNYVKSQNLD